MQGNQLLSVRTYLTQKIQRSPRKTPNKTDILKVMQAASCTHYANFYDILQKMYNRIDAQYFIENAVSNRKSCKRGYIYPSGPSYKLNGREKKIQNPSLSCYRIRSNVT